MALASPLRRRAALAVLAVGCASLGACAGGGGEPEPAVGRPTSSSAGETPAAASVELPVFDDDPCGKAPAASTGEYAELFDRWAAEEADAPIEPGRVVVTGSSSIRLWSSLQEELSAWAPVQRGFGGALLWDVAAAADRLIAVHDPSAVVVFAGANDIADGASAETTFDAYRCLLQRIRDDVGDVPVAIITITPTPLRWSLWPEAEELHRLLIDLADEWSGLHVVDGRAAYLATGEPPAEDLFLPDLLHLGPSGYAIWDEQAHAALDDVVTARVEPDITVRSGRYVVDVGAAAGPAADGARTVVTFPTEGGLTAGEQWRLVDAAGAPGPRLVVADWNLTPTPDRRAVYVRPSPFAHLTLEGVEPGTAVTASLRLAGPAGDPVEVSAVADDHARVHLHLVDEDHPALEVVGIDLVVGG